MTGQMDAQAPLPALCTSSDGHLSIYQVSFIPFNTFQRYATDKLFIAKIKKGSNSLNTGDRVLVIAFCNSFMAHYQCIKFHLFIFNTFRDMLQPSLLLQKLEREITLITCDRVTVLALCTSSDGCLSMYQVSFNSLQYIQRYAPDKFFIAKI